MGAMGRGRSHVQETARLAPVPPSVQHAPLSKPYGLSQAEIGEVLYILGVYQDLDGV